MNIDAQNSVQPERRLIAGFKVPEPKEPSGPKASGKPSKSGSGQPGVDLEALQVNKLKDPAKAGLNEKVDGKELVQNIGGAQNNENEVVRKQTEKTEAQNVKTAGESPGDETAMAGQGILAIGAACLPFFPIGTIIGAILMLIGGVMWGVGAAVDGKSKNTQEVAAQNAETKKENLDTALGDNERPNIINESLKKDGEEKASQASQLSLEANRQTQAEARA